MRVFLISLGLSNLVILASSQTGSAAGVADFNGDGIEDMVMANAAGSVLVSIGTGNLSYTTAFYEFPSSQFGPGEPETVVIGDFNNDAHPDFAVGTFNGGVGIYINGGDGTFVGPVTYQVGDDLGLATADVDGDGNLDLVGEDFIMLGEGNGQFEGPAPLLRTSSRPPGRRLTEIPPKATSIIGSTVALADFDGDHKLDIVTRTISTVFACYPFWRAKATESSSPRHKRCFPISAPAAVRRRWVRQT